MNSVSSAQPIHPCSEAFCSRKAIGEGREASLLACCTHVSICSTSKSHGRALQQRECIIAGKLTRYLRGEPLPDLLSRIAR